MKSQANIFIWVFACILLLNSCGSVSLQPIEIVNEVKRLKTNKDKQKYLEKIFEDDQKFRQGQSSNLWARYGTDSPQFVEYREALNYRDSINLVKVETYFEYFGHPLKVDVGDLASQVPYLVIHHSNSYEDRERNFPILFDAYNSGILEEEDFAFYLNRMHEMKFGDLLIPKGHYKEKDKIDEIIDKLDLGNSI